MRSVKWFIDIVVFFFVLIKGISYVFRLLSTGQRQIGVHQAVDNITYKLMKVQNDIFDIKRTVVNFERRSDWKMGLL